MVAHLSVEDEGEGNKEVSLIQGVVDGRGEVGGDPLAIGVDIQA